MKIIFSCFLAILSMSVFAKDTFTGTITSVKIGRSQHAFGSVITVSLATKGNPVDFNIPVNSTKYYADCSSDILSLVNFAFHNKKEVTLSSESYPANCDEVEVSVH